MNPFEGILLAVIAWLLIDIRQILKRIERSTHKDGTRL
jgi:hypothetical protein